MTSQQPEDPFQLNRELDRLIDGSLPEEDARQVQIRMKNDPKVFSLYLEKIRMESLLRDHKWTTPTAASRPLGSYWRAFSSRPLAWAAAVMLMAGTLFWLMILKPGLPEVAIGSPQLPSVQFSTAAVFDTTLAKLPNDGRLQFGDGVVMNDGSVSIRLPSGVEAILKSPSRFAIMGPNRLKLDEGMGWFRVPLEAKGFIVDLPDMEVTDLGTVFTVQADDDTQQVQVEQGRVEIKQRQAGLPVQALKAGEKLVRRAKQDMIQVETGISLLDPQVMEDRPEVVFQESLAAVPDQSFGNRLPLKGTWQVLAGDPQIRKGRFAARAVFTHLMGRFIRPIEPSENAVVMVSFKSVSPLSLFHSKGFAGISLFDQDGEILFLGDKGNNSYSWELLVYGKDYRRPQGPRRAYDLAIQGSEETFTLRYRQRTGAFEVFRGWGVQGLPVVRGITDPGLRIDGVRVANGKGGDFSFEDLQVSVVKDTTK